MRLLVFGRTGQVATELQRRCPSGWELTALGRDAVDLADPAACAGAVRAHSADAVINAAAYTAVDRAETDEALATTINGEAPAAMARAAAEAATPFLYISTDYVFDGTGSAPWRPDDPPAPLNAYGRSKRVGERGIAAAGGPHAILRTSWVFSAHGGNFLKTMLRLGSTRESLDVVADQHGGPTPAAAIADALFAIAEAFAGGKGSSGTYHFAGTPDTSWAGFARAIFAAAGLATRVNDIPTSAFPTPARRPLNSRLDCSSLLETWGIVRPDWRQGVVDALNGMETTRHGA